MDTLKVYFNVDCMRDIMQVEEYTKLMAFIHRVDYMHLGLIN